MPEEWIDKDCPDCQGSGEYAYGGFCVSSCETCLNKYRAKEWAKRVKKFEKSRGIPEQCTWCKGTGKWVADSTCGACLGTGWRPKNFGRPLPPKKKKPKETPDRWDEI